jgi:uncharacterized protein
MARGNFREYLKGEEVWVKKYFYVLRPILAMNWIERGLGIVPTDFNILVDRLVSEPKLRTEIGRLLLAKRAGAELDRAPRIESISEFIEHELERWEGSDIADHERTVSSDRLDELFRESLTEIWRS